MTTPVLWIDAASFVRGGRRILDDISWTVLPGEHWALLGPNGCGKTTLLSLATAYLWPTDGTVDVLGDRLGTVDVREKRRAIGLVTSALFERLPAHLSCADVIGSGPHASLDVFGEATDAARARVLDTARFLGCADILDRPYGVVSFGERQRILIGRALIADPALLILDEPCEGLDISARETVLGAANALIARPDGPTLVMVTHRVEEIPPGITHALILKEGRVLAAGPKDEVLTSEIFSAAMGVHVRILRDNGRLYALPAGPPKGAHSPNYRGEPYIAH